MIIPHKDMTSHHNYLTSDDKNLKCILRSGNSERVYKQRIIRGKIRFTSHINPRPISVLLK